jgi:hypothetical protein
MSQKYVDNITLSILLDIQKFIPNTNIQKLVEAVGVKYKVNNGSRELSDDELEVWAAGDLAAGYRAKKPEVDHE